MRGSEGRADRGAGLDVAVVVLVGTPEEPAWARRELGAIAVRDVERGGEGLGVGAAPQELAGLARYD